MSAKELKLTKLTKRFGANAAVADVSLTFEPGQFVSIIGRSGAGKSTLLRMINRLVEPTSGGLAASGRDVLKMKGDDLLLWRASCAMVFQQFNLAPRLDVISNVLMGRLTRVPWYRSWTKSFSHADQMAAMLILDDFGMAERAFERAERLSGGQQQRVAIARALMQEPSFILADEPTASLDPGNAEVVMETLRRINRERGITVIANLHNVALARAYSDRIVALTDGRVVFDGEVGALSKAVVSSVYGVQDPFSAELAETAQPAPRPREPVPAAPV